MVRNPRFVWSLAAVTALGLLGVVAACASQGEGDRCQVENGDNDCGDGLICTRSTDLPVAPNFRGAARDNEGRCCPSDRNRATVAECAQTPPAPGGDAALAPDAVSDGAVSEGGADANADSGDDSSTDASVDSGTDADANASNDANDAG